ncbi:MAG: anti-sigma factor, partial [Acidimicrobiales bacterium]
AHLATCPRCQVEFDSFSAVASALGNSVEPLPAGLWTNISSQLWSGPGEEADLPPLLVGAAGEKTISINAARAQRNKMVRASFAAASFAAAASIVVLAISLVGANNHVNNLQTALQGANRSVVQTALRTPGHQVVNLKSAALQPLAEFVLLPNGTGYLVKAKMPMLVSNQTYQLWAIVNGTPVSIGIMGSKPGHVSFTMASSPAPSELAVSIENAGGATQPTRPLAATGAV